MPSNSGTGNKVTVDKFSQLFDNGWREKTSAIRTKGRDTQKYEFTSSWDGKMADPKRFSRLQNTTIVSQKSNPVALLAGGAVHSLDDSISFQPLNVKHKPNRPMTIPLTLEQADLGMEDSLAGFIPLNDTDTRDKSKIVVAKIGTFRNLDLTKPTYAVVDVPSFILEAGPECDRKLLNPSQRRECMNFEKQRLEANHAIKSSKAFREKSRKQILGAKFQRGILMVDSADNEFSGIYGDTATERRSENAQREIVTAERRNNLASRSSSVLTNGDFILPNTITNNVSMVSDYQGKGGVKNPLSFEDTYSRLFVRPADKPTKPERTQTLRDHDLNGKEYNHIHHTIVEHWPSGQIKHVPDKVLQHPSQNSLESHRNTQGSTFSRKNYY